VSISAAAVEPSPEVSGLPTRMGGVRTRLGIMGGTFDPIHYGHLVTAEEALHQFELDEVLFVPTGRPWMKEHGVVSPPEDRYLMTVIATASNPLFGVSRIEVDRDGPTYAVDTLRELQHERGDDTDLFFVTGADAVLEIVEQWKQPDELFALAHFIAATRPGFDLEAFEAHAPTKHPGITVMNVPALAISSTDVRARVRAIRPIRYLVPEGVKSYIEKAGLYR
jgi:nicotinate-nucleotide adenylyltransferase